MTASKLAIPLMLVFGACQVCGQANSREPRIGYVYPAGGQRGTTFHVVVGGQFLRGAVDVSVSGEGVQVKVIRHYPPFRNVDREQRAALGDRIRAVLRQRWAELVEQGEVSGEIPWGELAALGLRRRSMSPTSQPADAEKVKPLEHPLTRDLEQKTLRELLHVVHTLRNQNRGQRNQQLAETVLLEIRIARDAAAGDRELRLVTPQGLTNPMVFQVDALPETRELEGAEGRIARVLPEEAALESPVVINGQIMPGDVDRFRFQARQGQQLNIAVCARQLIPYLADAVPGWFQATLALYDADGQELSFVDDYRFSPDPVLRFEVPADGEYELEIRDSIYRGREDFIYRIQLSERPFITSIFPLGCRAGQKRYVAADGWNMASERLFLDAQSDETPGIRQRPLGRGRTRSNPVKYAVNNLKAIVETESNDTLEDAQRVRLPRIVDGRIGSLGDVDVFEFAGRAGDELVAEVIARRVGSPLDSVVRVMDASGKVLAWNDDCEHKKGHLHTDMGVLTHHADSYVRATLPTDGTYYAQVTDVQSAGSAAHAYRLRIGSPQPDFELRVTPSSVNVRAGFAVPLRVHALRKDGFDGEIELVLKDAPPGFALAGALIPAGCDSLRATLTAAGRRLDGPVALTLEGCATIAGETVTRPVVPAEDMMQAFLYRHLTPSQELMVAVLGGRRFGSLIQAADEGPLRLPVGGAGELRINIPSSAARQKLDFDLHEPPAGIVLRKVRRVSGGVVLEIAASATDLPVGHSENLIVEVQARLDRGGRAGNAAARRRLVSLGVLPAIRFEIVAP